MGSLQTNFNLGPNNISAKKIDLGDGKIYLEQFISRENLALWLRADKGLFLNESNIITSWKDQSPNSNDAIARTGNVTLANNSINSKPALRFTGNSNLITNSFLPLNYHTPITMIAVSKASSGTVRGNQPTARYLTSVTNRSGYNYGLAYGSSGTQFPNFSNTYGRSFVSGSDIESPPIADNEVGIATSINNGSEISFYIDGVLIGTANPDPTIIRDNTSTISGLQRNINSTRSYYPNSFLMIYLGSGFTYPVNNTPLVLSSNMALLGNGATILGSTSTTAPSLISISGNSSFVSISETNISGSCNAYGIQGSGVSRVHIDKVNINGSGKDGIYLIGSGSNVYNNQITINNCQTSFAKSGGYAGIRLSNVTQAVCSNNIATGNSIGISLESSAYSTMFNNQSSYNTLTGIALSNSTGCKISKNICLNNPIGFTVLGNTNSQFNFFTANEAQGVQTGFLVGGSANVLYKNQIGTNLNSRISFTGAGVNRIIITDTGYTLVSGQDYFYPPTTFNRHTGTVIFGKARTNVNSSATTLSAVKTVYDAARASNPNNFIALNLTAPQIIGDATINLSSYTSVILDGTINLNSGITAFTSTSGDYISISSGIILGGNTTGRHALSFANGSRIMIENMYLNNFGNKNIRANDSDVIVFSGCGTPCMVTDCTIDGGAARGIWIKGNSISSTAGFVVSNNSISNMNMDGIDFDITTSNSLAIDNVCLNNIRYGVFAEEGANLNHIIRNTCSNNEIGLNVYSNTTGNTIRNSFIENICRANQKGIRFGALTPLETSQNFAFNNSVYNSTIFAIDAQGTGSQNYISQNYLYQNTGNLGSINSAVLFNGSPQGVTGTGQSVASNSLGSFAIGSEIVSGQLDNYFSTCDLAEVIIYNKALTTIEQQKVENYLKEKYAITAPTNYILNSKFDADNQYPIYDGSEFFDNNYYYPGDCGVIEGSTLCDLLTNYRHNSPLFYIPIIENYHTFANRTFHEIKAPYNILPIGHPIQPRLIKMFGAGTRFGRTDNTTEYQKTITNTSSLSPTINQSWVKYGVEQIVEIPSWATKVVYGVKYLAKSDDLFTYNNFAGLKLNFRLPYTMFYNPFRNYVNIHLIRRSTAPAIDTLESLYGSNVYKYFNNDLGSNATSQWLGPYVSRVKVRKRSSTIIDNNSDKFIQLSDIIDIPTFSDSSAEPDWGNGRPQFVSLEMFFAEAIPSLTYELASGSIYFYEPFIYFV
jgi:parallel beta-helix repeat protein